MRFRIVSDSSSNILDLGCESYTTVPLKIVAEKEYVDDKNLDVAGMVADLRDYKGKSGSSCPNVGEWLEAFEDAEEVFCVTISKNLSGSYNASIQAGQAYMDEHPGRKVFTFDSLAVGPEMAMIIDKIRACDEAGMSYDDTITTVLEYHNHLHTLFCLESMMNLARNGRVSMAKAKIAGMMGIRVVGAAVGGRVTPIHKPRGAKKATETLVEMIRERGFRDGSTLRIAHCFSQEAAAALQQGVLEQFPNAKFILEPTTALCSFYAEEGGLIIGFEGDFNTDNDNRVH